MENPPENNFDIYNIGSGNPIGLMTYVELIEKYLNKKSKKDFYPMQLGDVAKTYADISKLKNNLNFKIETTIEKGVKNFIDWYLKFYY